MKLTIELDNGTIVVSEQISNEGLMNFCQALTNIKHYQAIESDKRQTGDIMARITEAYSDEIREHALEMME